jgi:hypothetical protein
LDSRFRGNDTFSSQLPNQAPEFMRVSGQKWLGRRADTWAVGSKPMMPLKVRQALKLLRLTDQAAPGYAAGLPKVCHSRESGNPNALHRIPCLQH